MFRRPAVVAVFVVLAHLAVFAATASTTKALTPDPPAGTVVSLKANLLADTVHLEAQTEGVDVHVYYRSDTDTVVFDFPEVDADAVVAPPTVGDDLVAAWRVARTHFRRAAWEVVLRHPVPADNIHVTQQKGVTAVDIDRRIDILNSYRLTQGVKWYRREYKNGPAYLMVNELHVDLEDKTVRFDVGLAHDSAAKSVEPISDLVGRKGALAGINGGFFDRNIGPLGLIWERGKLLSVPVANRPPRTALGITEDHDVVMDQVRVEGDHLAGLNGTDWSKVVLALGGGPRLVKDGQVAITDREEGLGPGGNDINYRTYRTAIAVMPDHRLILSTVTGVLNGGKGGLFLSDLAQYFVSIHARDAMCLDGGGSTSMAIEGTLVSNPTRVRGEREVADALLVFDPRPILAPAHVKLTASGITTPADGKSEIQLEAHATTADGRDVIDGTPVQFDASLGFSPGTVKAKNGVARATWKAPPEIGTAMVTATCGFALDSAVIHLTAGPPAHLYVRATPSGPPPPAPSPSTPPAPSPSPSSNIDPADLPAAPPSVAPTPSPTPPPAIPAEGQLYMVDALVTDAAGNPLRSEPITGEYLQDGRPEKVTRSTDGSGTVTFAVRPTTPGAAIHVAHPTLGAKDLSLPMR